MADYIRREDALYAIQRQRGATRSPAQNRLLDLLRVDIVRAPAADVAEVVHAKWIPFHFKNVMKEDYARVLCCKDCKYGSYDSKQNGAMICLRTNDGFWRKETDFCSYGEYQTNTGGSNNVAD